MGSFRQAPAYEPSAWAGPVLAPEGMEMFKAANTHCKHSASPTAQRQPWKPNLLQGH